MNVRSCILAMIFGQTFATFATAGYPALSLFTKQQTGSYQAVTPRYIVVDPVPAAVPGVPGNHGASHGNASVQWERRDLPQPAYPYGWFGARHATVRWSHTGYYGTHTDVRTLRGQ